VATNKKKTLEDHLDYARLAHNWVNGTLDDLVNDRKERQKSFRRVIRNGGTSVDISAVTGLSVEEVEDLL
jgi:hypothetical protein